MRSASVVAVVVLIISPGISLAEQEHGASGVLQHVLTRLTDGGGRRRVAVVDAEDDEVRAPIVCLVDDGSAGFARLQELAGNVVVEALGDLLGLAEDLLATSRFSGEMRIKRYASPYLDDVYRDDGGLLRASEGTGDVDGFEAMRCAGDRHKDGLKGLEGRGHTEFTLVSPSRPACLLLVLGEPETHDSVHHQDDPNRSSNVKCSGLRQHEEDEDYPEDDGSDGEDVIGCAHH